MSNNIERRFTTGSVERRQTEVEEMTRLVRGYAAKFNTRSENLGTDKTQFFETILPGAFDDVLLDDVRCLFNHDANLILARSKAGKGSLRIGVDSTGLWYEFESPDTQTGEDLLESLSRGDVDQSSFAFTVAKDGQEWKQVKNGESIVNERTIKKVSKLYDVSPVTYPAYADTSVALRNMPEPVSDPDFSAADRERRLRILSLSSL